MTLRLSHLTRTSHWSAAYLVCLLTAQGCSSPASNENSGGNGASIGNEAAGAGATVAAAGTTSAGGNASPGGGAGATGAAGASGSANPGGTAGAAGTGGVDGAAGTTGTAGGAETGGANGSAGAAGAAGIGGAGGTAGALIHNDTFWKDTSGATLYSQSGNIIKVGNTYYWYGDKYSGAVAYAANPTKAPSTSTLVSVTCYSSSDLVHWKFESDVFLPNAIPNSGSADWFGRMGVAYNANTKKYVLIMVYAPAGAALAEEVFATSSSPTGPFAFDHIQSSLSGVVNNAPGDQTIFTDDDGTSYLILSSAKGRANLYVAPLRPSDYLAIQPATRIAGGPGREGNCIFKYNGRYYYNSSDLHGFNASHTYTISATNIMGPYSAETVMAGTDADFSHVTQTGFFVTVHGTSQSTVIFAGDRWSDFAGNGIGYNDWMPLKFNGTTPQFQSLSEWSFDAATGTWSVGPDNNYALNPSFEADRVTMTQPAGWTTTTTTGGGVTPYSNVSGGHSGNWSWRLSNSAAYQATLNQAVSGLPNGTYTLSVWAKSSGGQTTANLYAKGFGGTEKDAALTQAMSSWTQVTIPGIAVANGSCQIGITTTAGANQSVTVDDFSFVRTGS